MARIQPLEPPFAPDVGHQLEALMPHGVPPIALFRTFARNMPTTRAMTGWGLYELSSDLSLTMRDREIVVDRTCALCSCEYEWGVHIKYFADRVGLTADQITSLTHGCPTDPCWTTEHDRLLIRASDSLHDSSDLGDELWVALSSEFDEQQLLDIMLLCGWYHAISFAANGSRVEPEPGTLRFADVRRD